MLQGELTLRQGAFLLESGPFAIETSGITVLFGRSGSGKSTLLRAITGLDKNTRGTLLFNGERWQEGAWRLPTPKRDIGFVFQDAALFPHLTVRGNLEYALKRAPASSPALGETGGENGLIFASLHEVAERVGIAHKLEQSVTTLSGGERQRVAIARALLSRPRLMCMDEPLSALDWRAKAELLPLIDALAHETGIPVLYITHAPVEVERLASRVVFMSQGRIERIETLREALARPDSPLFDEEGPVAVLEGRMGAPSPEGLIPFAGEGWKLWLTAPQAASQANRLRVLARDVTLALDDPQGISVLNHLPITIERIDEPHAGRVTVVGRLSDGQRLLAEITAVSVQRLRLSIGQQVYALIKSVALME